MDRSGGCDRLGVGRRAPTVRQTHAAGDQGRPGRDQGHPEGGSRGNPRASGAAQQRGPHGWRQGGGGRVPPRDSHQRHRHGEDAVSDLQQQFAQSVARLIQKAAELGYGVTLGEAWRSPEQAALNASHGTGIAHSLHTERLAIDLNLFKDGLYLTDSAPYVELGTWLKTFGPSYRFGGDF